MNSDEGDLHDEFSLGDGRADTEVTVFCPYCGEENDVGVDPGGGSRQEYSEDCQVCCRPWHVVVSFDACGEATLHVEAADGG